MIVERYQTSGIYLTSAGEYETSAIPEIYLTSGIISGGFVDDYMWFLSGDNDAIYTCVSLVSPIIYTQPISMSASQGETSAFSVVANGIPSPCYKWYKDGIFISDAILSTYTITSAVSADEGNYYVLVYNFNGSTSSDVVTFDFIPSYLSGIVAWWKCENNILDSVNNISGAWIGTSAYETGYVNNAISASNNGYVYIDDNELLKFTSAMSIEFWMKRTAPYSTYDVIIDKDRYKFKFDSTNNLSMWLSIGYSWKQSSTYAITNGQWTHVVGTYDGTNINFYVNGSINGSPTNAPGTIDISSYPLYIGTDAEYGNKFYNGLIDEITFWNRAITSAEVLEIYNRGTLGK